MKTGIELVRESIHTNDLATITGYSGTMRRLYRHPDIGAIRIEMLSRPKSISLAVAVLRNADWTYLHTEDLARPDDYDFAAEADQLAETWCDLISISNGAGSDG